MPSSPARRGAVRGPEKAWSLGDFYIEEEIFRTHNGGVFKARFRNDRRLCVLKERKCAELGKDGDIKNEVAILERMDHPNVVRCFGHFTERKTRSLYIVLEYAARGDLFRVVERRRAEGRHFREQDVWRIFLQICRGLQHLHGKSVVHRDLKTLNIFVAADGTIKIGDLGVGRQVGPHTEMLHTFYGTPLYASPELCCNKPYNSATDIWSLGIVLYELASLKTPFGGCRSLAGLADAIRAATYAPLPKHCSPMLSRAVAALLQKDPAKRPTIGTILGWFAPRPDPKGEPAKKGEPSQPAQKVEEKAAAAAVALTAASAAAAAAGAAATAAAAVAGGGEARPGSRQRPRPPLQQQREAEAEVGAQQRGEEPARPARRGQQQQQQLAEAKAGAEQGKAAARGGDGRGGDAAADTQPLPAGLAALERKLAAARQSLRRLQQAADLLRGHAGAEQGVGKHLRQAQLEVRQIEQERQALLAGAAKGAAASSPEQRGHQRGQKEGEQQEAEQQRDGCCCSRDERWAARARDFSVRRAKQRAARAPCVFVAAEAAADAVGARSPPWKPRRAARGRAGNVIGGGDGDDGAGGGGGGGDGGGADGIGGDRRLPPEAADVLRRRRRAHEAQEKQRVEKEQRAEEAQQRRQRQRAHEQQQRGWQRQRRNEQQQPQQQQQRHESDAEADTGGATKRPALRGFAALYQEAGSSGARAGDGKDGAVPAVASPAPPHGFEAWAQAPPVASSGNARSARWEARRRDARSRHASRPASAAAAAEELARMPPAAAAVDGGAAAADAGALVRHRGKRLEEGASLARGGGGAAKVAGGSGPARSRLGISGLLAAYERLQEWAPERGEEPVVAGGALPRSPTRGHRTRRAVARLHADGVGADLNDERLPRNAFGGGGCGGGSMPLRKKRYNIISGEYEQ